MTMREYARASVMDVGIRISGVMLGTVAIGAIQALLSAIATVISRLPPWLKMAVIVAAIVAVLHPRTRVWIAEQWRLYSPAALNVWNDLAPAIMKFGQLAQAKRFAAEALPVTPHTSAVSQSACEHDLTSGALCHPGIAGGFPVMV